jgi:L-alanine-DL-glutamate epimerase-like enolase superfamily enzyme
MKIDQIDLYVFDTPLPNPLANPITSGASIFTVLAIIKTDSGLTGQGYGWTIGAPRAKFIRGATEVAAEFILGRDPIRTEAIWSAYDAMSNFVGTSGLAVIGMSILDIALWDIAGQAAGLPLWKLLGGHKERARMYMNLVNADASGVTPVEQIVEAFEHGWSAGFREFKARIGINSPQFDVPRIRRLIELAGSKGRFAVDMAQRWSPADAMWACTAMDDLGLFWMEDPGHQDDMRNMREIVERIHTPICTGENAYGLRGATRIVEELGCDYMMLDLERCGGITGWKKAAAVAETRNIKMTTHVYPHVGVHLICGTSNATIGEYVPWWDELFDGPIEVVDGYATPSNTPGNGKQVTADKFSRAVSHDVVRA